MIIKPIPVVNKIYPNNITGRYLAVLVRTTPATADISEAPKENESILRNEWSDLPTATSRTNAYCTPASVAEAPRT